MAVWVQLDVRRGGLACSIEFHCIKIAVLCEADNLYFEIIRARRGIRFDTDDLVAVLTDKKERQDRKNKKNRALNGGGGVKPVQPRSEVVVGEKFEPILVVDGHEVFKQIAKIRKQPFACEGK